MNESVESTSKGRSARLEPQTAHREVVTVANKVAGRVKFVSVVVIGASAFVLLRSLPLDSGMAALRDWVAGLGVWGPVVFGSIYALATVFALPGLILTVSAGALFGLMTGFITASLASTTGAGLAFLVARHLARDRVGKAAKSHALFGAIDAAIGQGGWRIVALLRLSPVVPFNLQNFMFGLTPVRFWSYLLASWIAMMPGTFLYVYVGHLTGAAVNTTGRSAGEWVLLVVGLAATIVVSWYVSRLARRQLAEQGNRSVLDESSSEEGTEPSVGGSGWPWGATVVAVAALLLAAAAMAVLLDAP